MNEFVDGKPVTDTVLSSSLGSFKDLHIANVLYPYGTLYGTTFLLGHNDTIYMGDIIESFLANHLQSDENGIHIDIRPKNYYSDDSVAHTVTLPDVTIIIILCYGVLPYIPVWYPRTAEIDSSLFVTFKSWNSCYPFLLCTFTQCSNSIFPVISL